MISFFRFGFTESSKESSEELSCLKMVFTSSWSEAYNSNL